GPVTAVTGPVAAAVASGVSRLGVVEFFPKPDMLPGPSLEARGRALDWAAETARLIKEPVRLPGDAGTEGPVLLSRLGDGPMAEIYRRIGAAAKDPARERPVLIVGETGTGKELVARALFHHSARRDGPFLKVKCTAFQEEELEAELFGHDGDDRRQVGAFEKAHGGAVLLDDAGETGRGVQAKLLQVLNEGTVIRGGRGTRAP